MPGYVVKWLFSLGYRAAWDSRHGLRLLAKWFVHISIYGRTNVIVVGSFV